METCVSTNKSDLMKAVLQTASTESQPEVTIDKTVFIVDLMALIRTIREIPDTFEDLTFKIIKSIPAGYKRVGIVSDSYLINSIKTSERKKRGVSSRIQIKSAKSKIPRDFSKFLSNSENKIRMVELLFEVIEEKKAKVLNLLKTSQLIIAKEDMCRSITLSCTEELNCLASNQEEAATKVILHCSKAVLENQDTHVILRSPSGDTDILVLAVSLLANEKQ